MDLQRCFSLPKRATRRPHLHPPRAIQSITVPRSSKMASSQRTPVALHSATSAGHTQHAPTNNQPQKTFSSTSMERLNHSSQLTKNYTIWRPSVCPRGSPPMWQTLHKWADWSWLGIYLGTSAQHSHNIALVLNPTTGHVSLQYHVSANKAFDTVKDLRGTGITWA